MWYVISKGDNGTVRRESNRGAGLPSAATVIDKAEFLTATKIRTHELSNDPLDKPHGFDVIIEKADGRVRTLESVRDDGTVLARNGVNIASGQPTRWLQKCADAALPLPAMPVRTQITNEDLARCWSRGTAIPAETRVQNCTQLIERGQREGLSKEVLAVVYSNRGIAYRAVQRTEQAIADYTQAIALKPDLADAYYNRANAYGEKRLYDQAIADYTVAIRLAPDVPGYANRGWTYERKGERDLAIADYRLVLQLDPSNEYAQSALDRLGVRP
jgi:tetratricopeptide (TPR) repeat protein